MFFNSKPRNCIEGKTIKLTCSVCPDNNEQKWFKGKQELHKCQNIMIKNGIQSVFSRPLVDVTILEGFDAKFECETAEFNCPVRWFKGNAEIFDTNCRIKIDKLPGHIHTLTILQTSLKDSGEYRIKSKGCESVAKLNVQATFTSKSKSQNCIEGDNIQLSCSVFSDRLELKWYKWKQELHECPDILITKNGFQRILTILNSTVRDSGTYYAKAGKEQTDIQVTVKALFSRPLVDVTILEGFDAKFECETAKFNCPVRWFKGNAEIFDTNCRIKIDKLPGHKHTLTILQTSLTDSGEYRIKSKGCESVAKLNVQATFTSKSKSQNCIEGDNIQLSCSVFSDRLEVKWYKWKQELHECPDILITKNGFQRILTILNSTVRDSGTYYAKAGKEQTDIQVTVKARRLHRKSAEVSCLGPAANPVQLTTNNPRDKTIIPWVHPQDMTYPTTSPGLDGVGDAAHVGSLQQFCVGNCSWPKYPEDVKASFWC
ncbi:TTN [Mytilus coruscus]|uniref:TTN n=1 Tax=Mytilus coruscus TaxID=42192 RepID=A0A6J8AKL7_MYTCO|nr:TTN [Mytilus coruscus]